MGVGPAKSRWKELFCSVVFGMGESWRRFVHYVDTYPWYLFRLCHMSEEEFWVQWQKVESGCQGCVDVELTKGLLLACPTDEACRTDFYERVKALLTDLATFTPLSTDSVETVHGHIQSRIHKFRSRLKQAEASSERTLLMSLIAEQKDTLGMVKLETLPKAQCVAAIQRTESRNKKGPRTELRRINGWNVFLRESLKGPKLSKTDFKRMERELGSKWKQMSQTDKQRYEVRAMWEMTRRDHWLQTPLPIGSNVDDCAQELGQRMQHKMNLHRLGLNFRLMQEHSAWDMGLALSDSHGALRQQFIELDQTDEDIEAHVLPRLASVEPLQSDVKLGPRDFAGTCHMIHGLCGEAKNLQQVQGLVRSLAQVLKRCGLRRGALLQLYPDGSDQDCEACFTCFLASQVVRPMQHVFVIGSWAAKDKVSIERQAGPIPVPEMRTSAELFDLLLQIRGGRVEPKPRVCLRELEYEWDPVRCSSSDDELSPSLLQVTILKEGPVKMLNGPNPMRSQGKRKKRLPFGFDKFKKRAAGQTVMAATASETKSNAIRLLQMVWSILRGRPRQMERTRQMSWPRQIGRKRQMFLCSRIRPHPAHQKNRQHQRLQFRAELMILTQIFFTSRLQCLRQQQSKMHVRWSQLSVLKSCRRKRRNLRSLKEMKANIRNKPLFLHKISAFRLRQTLRNQAAVHVFIARPRFPRVYRDIHTTTTA